MKPPSMEDRFQIKHPLGAGGMGVVFLARDLKLKRLVALKRLAPRHANSDKPRRRFEQEAEIMARLDDPAVVRLYDVYQDGNTDYLVMEYVQGITLHQCIRQGSPLSVGRVLRLGRQIADGMAAAHAAGIIHRDLKTENVLVDSKNNARITDFGIAKVLGEDSMTVEGIPIGTYKAMSPEQALGEKDVDERTDLFSFGILLYEALAGMPPFSGENTSETIDAILRSEPRPLAELRSDLPPALRNLLERLLQKERELRPSGGFAEIAEKLNEIANALTDEEERADALGNDTGPRLGSDDDETLSVDSPAPELGPEAPSPKITTQKLLAGASQSAEPAPRRRPLTWLGLGALGLAVLALAVGPWRTSFLSVDQSGISSGPGQLVVANPGPTQTLRYVVVDEPQLSDCGDADKTDIRTVQHALTAALVELEGVGVLSQEMPPNSAAMDRRVDKQVDALVIADEHLSAFITCRSGLLDIVLQRTRPSGMVMRQSREFTVDHADLGRSDTTIHSNIQALFPEHAARTGRFVREDVDQFLRLRQAYWQKEPGFSIERVIAELASIRERSPGLLDVYRFEAELWRHRYILTRNEQHYEQAWSLLATARELDPASPLVLSGIVILALDHRDFSEAERVLTDMARLSPASGLTLYLRARIEERRGNRRVARDLLEKAAQEHGSWRILYHLASMEMSLGMIDEARQHLGQLLASSPGNIAGEELRVCLALITGENEDACQKIDFNNVARVNNCAFALMDDGHYDAAAVMLGRARELNPNRPETAFNLGEALLLSGRDEEAAPVFHDVLSLIQPDIGDLGMLTIRAQALAHLQVEPDARWAIELALQNGQGDTDIHYAAAATYALIGDREQTIEWIQATLPSSYGPASFSYPWFDFVRDDPRVRERLAPADETTTPR